VPLSIYEVEGARDVAIECCSFSKTAGFTGTRCAYMVIPHEITGLNSKGEKVSLNAMWKRRQGSKFNGVSYPVQRAAAAIYTPEGQQQIREVIDAYLENAHIIRDSLIAQGFTAFGGVDSPYVWLKVPDGMTSWEFFDQLLDKGYEVVVRPHPEYVKRYQMRMDKIVERYQGREESGLKFELDFTSNTSIFDSDVLITDWSGTAYEFSFVTLKPAVFIDTKPKINNPEYQKLGIEPLEFALRSQVGVQVKPDALDGLNKKIDELLANGSEYEQKILGIREKYIANFGMSGEIGGRYIISQLVARKKKRSE